MFDIGSSKFDYYIEKFFASKIGSTRIFLRQTQGRSGINRLRHAQYE
jgi:hypothetical protein